MGKRGCTCDDPDLVPVKDCNLLPPYTSGNPYSRYCRTCGRRYFCAKSFWEKAKERFIIPSGEGDPVHTDEYDDENYFECPSCGKPHFGYPDVCGCGVEYDWGDEVPVDA